MCQESEKCKNAGKSGTPPFLHLNTSGVIFMNERGCQGIPSGFPVLWCHKVHDRFPVKLCQNKRLFTSPCCILLQVGGSSAETPHGHFRALILYDHDRWGAILLVCHLHQLVSTAAQSAHSQLEEKLKADGPHPRVYSTHRQTPWTDNDSSLLFAALSKAKPLISTATFRPWLWPLPVTLTLTFDLKAR